MLNFKELRDQWALKCVVSKETIDAEYRSDQMANPHNDHYPNKRRRRVTGEIVADVSYNYADEVLTQIYGSPYATWLRNNTQEPDNQSRARRYKTSFQEYASAI